MYNYYDRYAQLYLSIGTLSQVSYMVHRPLANIGFSAIAPSITNCIVMQQCSISSARVPVPDGAHERPRKLPGQLPLGGAAPLPLPEDQRLRHEQNNGRQSTNRCLRGADSCRHVC